MPKHDPPRPDCLYAGRRVRTAYAWASAALRAGLEEAEGWDVNEFGLPNVDELQGAVRASVSYGMDLLDPYSRIPFLAARLDEPGIRDQCLAQWAAAPRHQHDEASAYLFEDAPGTLRQAVLAIHDDGTIEDPQLKSEVESIQLIPFDDTVNERPHARAARITKHAPASKIPWVASSMRVAENLDTIRRPGSALHGEQMRQYWLRYKDALVGGRRCKRAVFERNLYTMHHLLSDDMQRRHAGEGGDDSADDDDGPPPPPPHEGKEEQPPATPARELSEAANLFKEWLLLALQVYSVFTLPNNTMHRGRQAFQLLSIEQKTLRLHTYATRAEPSMALQLRVQPFETWEGVEEDASRMHIFPVEGTRKIDALQLVGEDPNARHGIFKWQVARSAVEGCQDLINPVPADPNIQLSDRQVPILCLLDALNARGWIGTPALCTHGANTPKLFDNRKPLSKRAYFQSLLVLDELMSKGAQEYDSSGTQAFYQLLMKSPRCASQNMSAASCKAVLARECGDSEAAPSLAVSSREAKKRRGAVSSEPLLEVDEFGGAEAWEPPPVQEEDAPATAPGSDSSESSSSSETDSTKSSSIFHTGRRTMFGGWRC